jgi:hypothetical protein
VRAVASPELWLQIAAVRAALTSVTSERDTLASQALELNRRCDRQRPGQPVRAETWVVCRLSVLPALEALQAAVDSKAAEYDRVATELGNLQVPRPSLCQRAGPLTARSRACSKGSAPRTKRCDKRPACSRAGWTGEQD